MDRLAEEIARREKAEGEKEALLNNAALFIKELNCLYGLAELISKYGDSLDEIFALAARLIPPSWQYPEITCARILFKDKEFKTDDFKDTQWKQSSDIIVSGKKYGTVEVCLLEARAAKDEGPFTSEERRLIKAVADRIGMAVERIEMREDLIRAGREAEDNYKKLKELEGLKNSLTHMIVHDLNNPLSSILGFIQLWKMRSWNDLSHDEKESMDIAILAGQELKLMTGNLLDINKMEEGKIKLRYEDFNVADVAKEVAGQLQLLARLDDKALSVENTGSAPAVSADKDLIKRVIANLTSNALKYTPSKGSVTIIISYENRENCLYVRVKDTGDGIPKEYLEKIFDKFVQVETKKARTGRGLGLTFCKMAVQAHGGRIWVESEPGKGSVFTFTLPYKK